MYDFFYPLYIMKLDDFKKYQEGQGTLNNETLPNFERALLEIKAGAKTGHWSWYVMPTDKSSRAFQNKFKLNRDEALAYIHDSTLRNRYLRFMSTVSNQLNKGIEPNVLLMSMTDVRKAYNSASLFKEVSKNRYNNVYRVTCEIEKKLKPYVQQPKQQATPRHALFAQLIQTKKPNL